MAGERDAAGRNARVIGLGVAIEQIDLLVRALAAYGDNDVSRNQLNIHATFLPCQAYTL